MKARNPSTGTLDTVYVKALDSMPVGTQIEYTGDTIPTGWEEVNDYSTDEVNTGKKWIDGKPIYRKIVNFGNLPNTTTKNVVHNISNIDFITNYYAIATNSTAFWKLPFVSTSTISSGLQMTIDKTNIIIVAGVDRSSYSAYVIIEYTKTTD